MGLRNEEVRWSTWDAIDYERGIYYVQRTTCQLTGEVWTPKDAQMREIKDIEGRLMSLCKTRPTCLGCRYPRFIVGAIPTPLKTHEPA